ncbi:MAG TPA: hypothetical protein VL588_10615, partial [Bdellovibrionota bacterium]|nr:hypothetical protein [Bdellovibrionota bacterium]
MPTRFVPPLLAVLVLASAVHREVLARPSHVRRVPAAAAPRAMPVDLEGPSVGVLPGAGHAEGEAPVRQGSSLSEVVVEIQRVKQEVHEIDRKLDGLEGEDASRESVALRDKRDELLQTLVPLFIEAHVRKAPGYSVSGVFDQVKEVGKDSEDGGDAMGTLLVGFTRALIEKRNNESLEEWKGRVLEGARKFHAATDVALLSLKQELDSGLYGQALKTERAILGLYQEFGDVYPFDAARDQLSEHLLRLHAGTVGKTAQKRDFLLMADLGSVVTKILDADDPRQYTARLVLIRSQKALGHPERSLEHAQWLSERIPDGVPTSLPAGLDLREALVLGMESDMALVMAEGDPPPALTPRSFEDAKDKGAPKKLGQPLGRWVALLERLRSSEHPFAVSARADNGFAMRLAREELQAARLLARDGSLVRAAGLLRGAAAGPGAEAMEARLFLEKSAQMTRDPGLAYRALEPLYDALVPGGGPDLARVGELAAKRFLAHNRALFADGELEKVLDSDWSFQKRFAWSTIKPAWMDMLRQVALKLQGAPAAEPYYTEVMNTSKSSDQYTQALVYRAMARERLFDFGGAAADYRNLLLNTTPTISSPKDPKLMGKALEMAWLSPNPMSLPQLLADNRV